MKRSRKPASNMPPDGEAKPDGDMQPDGEPQNVDADGYPDGDRTAPLFPVAGGNDWNNPQLRLLGKKLAEQAYILADELGSYGADAEQLLLPPEEQRTDRPWSLEVPPRFLDAVQAVFLSLPRPGQQGPRSGWSLPRVLAMIEKGVSVRAAAKAEAARTGVDWETIDRTTRAWRARHKQGGAD